MKIAVATLESITTYCQGNWLSTPKKEKETHEDYEARVWQDRLHVAENGHVFIPPFAFKNSLQEAAKYLKMQIPGEGKSTYTKHFEAGVLVLEGLELPEKKGDVKPWPHRVPPDGTPGGKKKVLKYFPIIPHWKGQVTYHILDDTITEKVFTKALKASGQFIGIGSMRPINRGIFGRFKVVKVNWEEEDADLAV